MTSFFFSDEYWSQHPELHGTPIYYASSLAKKCMAVYQTYVNAMNDKIRRQIAINNPFIFRHISNLKGIDHFEDIGPCVVMASPGMMQSGLSRELFELWCTDAKNGVIIAGSSSFSTEYLKLCLVLINVLFLFRLLRRGNIS